jgi:two-component system CheB/CheR fusion protein
VARSKDRRRESPRQAAPRPLAHSEEPALDPDQDFGQTALENVPTVVGVGASAGGLEAFSQLLEALPSTADVAIVFVQHLSPQHESALQALLASRTPLPVIQVVEGLRIESRHIYVIPPNVQMGIKEGVLHLLPRPFDRTQFTPIDFFLQSLARWAHNRAIGVILSGTASDGAAGIREIKAAGGITFAQKPRTAKYDGMPRAAVATGMVDLVLSPQEIAEQLAHIQTHPYLGQPALTPSDSEIPVTEAQLGEIFTLLRRVSGVDFRQYKMPTIKRRLLRRMALHRLTDSSAYIRFARENQKEVHALYQDLLIHVTRFFREPDSFSALTTEVFPDIVESRSEEEPIRIWVPGCATGEEAYSVAMALLENLGDQAGSRRLQIFATDVSESAIDTARAGVYPMSISADVSPERLKRFFTKNDGAYKVSKALRDACVFARHDLTRDPPFSRLDLIVCRNVMIYLDPALQKRLMAVFHYALKSTGFLMLGPAETTGHQHLFAVVDKRWRLYRKAALDTSLPINFSIERYPHLPVGVAPPRSTPKPDGRSLHEEATRLLLQKYGPPSVVVDENLQIVQFRGQTGRFLEPASGEPNLNLLKMAREGLLFPLRSALQIARRKHRTVRKENVSVRRNGDWHDINIEVLPLSAGGGRHFIVTFDEATPEGRPERRSGGRRPGARGITRRESDERIAGLTRELAASREYLQSIIQELEAANEELQSANEEILSSNEELQSTNEELDTAKEELQSTNEELNTVNEELHSRNEELSHVNSDLVNLLATVDITILIVGDDMRIRRFTPTAERVLNLIPGDVGRPVGQINTNIVAENLESLIRETIDTMTPRELEAQDRQGHWYSLRIRPYKNVDNRIDGAVVTVMDIGAVKRYQEQLERSRAHLVEVIEILREPALVLDEVMTIRAVTEAFLETFHLASSDVAGKVLVDIGKKRWNAPGLRALLKQMFEANGAIETGVIEHDFVGDGRMRRLRVTGRRIPFEDTKWTVLTLQDVTDGGDTA